MDDTVTRVGRMSAFGQERTFREFRNAPVWSDIVHPMSTRASRILGVPNPLWAIASVCLAILACLVIDFREGDTAPQGYLSLFASAGSTICGLLTARFAFAQKSLRPLAAIAALVNLLVLLWVGLAIVFSAAYVR